MAIEKGTIGHFKPTYANQTYTEEEKEIMFDEILNLISEGNKISDVLTSNTNYPHPSTSVNWLDNAAFTELYTHAQEVTCHVLYDDVVTIAKCGDRSTDTVVAVQRDRLITDRLIFAISKMFPHKYGDKIDVTSNGEAINVVSLGVGIAPPATQQEPTYIDITPTYIGAGKE